MSCFSFKEGDIVWLESLGIPYRLVSKQKGGWTATNNGRGSTYFLDNGAFRPATKEEEEKFLGLPPRAERDLNLDTAIETREASGLARPC